MANGVTRVIERCENATESEILDLSECQLIQIPDAVFHLMRNTTLKKCILAANAITRISPKVGSKFTNITELLISNNKISTLPDDLSQLQVLIKLDISFNTFCSFPRVIFSMKKLQEVNAEKNYIIEVEKDGFGTLPCIKKVNLLQNPISRTCHDSLSTITEFTMLLPVPKKEDWEFWMDELH